MTSTIASLSFDPLIPLPALAVLATLSAALVAVAFIRRATGTIWRAAAFLLLLGTLSGPMLIRETRAALSDIALLVTDHTRSMQVGNRALLATEAEQKLRAEAATMPGLELRTASVPPGHNGTELFIALAAANASIPPDRFAGVIALTDGNVHDKPIALPPGVPFHALLAARGEEWDRRVRVLEAPRYGIVGRSLPVRVVIEDLGHGAPDHATATLTLRRDDLPPETRSVPVGEVQTLDVPIARAGPTVLAFSTPEAPGEASPQNNSAAVEVEGVRDRLRVLLVSGEPNQGERSWRRLLKSDPAVDLVHFTILRPPEKDDTTPLNELALIAFPTRELFADKLSGFDLIILDRFTDRGILPHQYLRNIAEYVRSGGALLLTVGPEFATPESLDQTPLADVLPAHAPLATEGVVAARFRPALTALGRRHPVTAELPGAGPGDAPWGRWYREIEGEDVHGQVVMTGAENRPLLVLDHVGEGRAAILLSDQIWLWGRGHDGGGPENELLRRIAHWLMKQPELDEERLSARVEDGQLAVERRSLSDQPPAPVTVTTPAGTRAPLSLARRSPGLFAGRRAAANPGVWQATDGTRTAYAIAGEDNPLERADLRATADVLRPVAERSGGSVVWLGRDGVPALRQVSPDAAAAGAGWIGLPRRGAHTVTGVSTTPLLPSWLMLPLLLGVVAGAWWRESR